MRPAWKPYPHAGFGWDPRPAGVVWATQAAAVRVALYTGRAWLAQRTRRYYLTGPAVRFVRSRARGRPVRDKFRRLGGRGRPRK